MENVVSVGMGAVLSLMGVVLGSWFTARRRDRMWLREQKLTAAVDFNTVAGQLYEELRHKGRESAAPDRSELAGRMQEGRSAIHLLCSGDTVILADALAQRVFHARPTDGEDERAETIDLLCRFTHQLRHEIGAGP